MKKIETIKVTKKCSDKEIAKLAGKIWKDSSGCQIFTNSVDVVLPNGKYLARFRKNMIDISLCQLGFNQYQEVGFKKSNNRGNAAGRYSETAKDETQKQYRHFDASGGKAIYETDSKEVNSGIMGFMDSPNWRHPCRQTAFTKSHFQQYSQGLPFIKAIDSCYQKLRPAEHEIQRKEALKSNYHIDNTAFSTITVNANFQTGLHKDSGDFTGGFGNLVITEKGEYQGGYTLFPQFGVGFDCRMRDFLAMDVHQWHCNTPLEIKSSDSVRLSFVCYLRNRMHQCPMLDKILPTQTKLTSAEKIREMAEWTGKPREKGKVERKELGVGNFGHNWYELIGPVYRIKYYNKQYTILNRLTSEQEHSLTKGYYHFKSVVCHNVDKV